MDKKEVFRDVLALGSFIFYFIVIVRALIGNHLPFVYQLVISFVVVLLLGLVFKNSNNHLGRILILVVFTSLFYGDVLYAVFVSLVFVLAIFGSYYLKKDVWKGLVVSVVASLVGYFITQML